MIDSGSNIQTEILVINMIYYSYIKNLTFYSFKFETLRLFWTIIKYKGLAMQSYKLFQTQINSALGALKYCKRNVD